MKIFSAMYQNGRQNGKTMSEEFVFLMKSSAVGDSRALIAKPALAHQIPFLFRTSTHQILTFHEGQLLWHNNSN